MVFPFWLLLPKNRMMTIIRNGFMSYSPVIKDLLKSVRFSLWLKSRKKRCQITLMVNSLQMYSAQAIKASDLEPCFGKSENNSEIKPQKSKV